MLISKDLEVSNARSVSCWHSVLTRSIGKSLEEIVAELINAATVARLLGAMTVIFTYAIGAVIESADFKKKKKNRLKEWHATAIIDITQLLNYLSEVSCHFPTSVLASHNLSPIPPHTSRNQPPPPTHTHTSRNQPPPPHTHTHSHRGAGLAHEPTMPTPITRIYPMSLVEPYHQQPCSDR